MFGREQSRKLDAGGLKEDIDRRSPGSIAASLIRH